MIVGVKFVLKVIEFQRYIVESEASKWVDLKLGLIAGRRTVWQLN